MTPELITDRLFVTVRRDQDGNWIPVCTCCDFEGRPKPTEHAAHASLRNHVTAMRHRRAIAQAHT